MIKVVQTADMDDDSYYAYVDNASVQQSATRIVDMLDVTSGHIDYDGIERAVIAAIKTHVIRAVKQYEQTILDAIDSPDDIH